MGPLAAASDLSEGDAATGSTPSLPASAASDSAVGGLASGTATGGFEEHGLHVIPG
jgi:hypothetical protein